MFSEYQNAETPTESESMKLCKRIQFCWTREFEKQREIDENQIIYRFNQKYFEIFNLLLLLATNRSSDDLFLIMLSDIRVTWPNVGWFMGWSMSFAEKMKRKRKYDKTLNFFVNWEFHWSTVTVIVSIKLYYTQLKRFLLLQLCHYYCLFVVPFITRCYYCIIINSKITKTWNIKKPNEIEELKNWRIEEPESRNRGIAKC